MRPRFDKRLTGLDGLGLLAGYVIYPGARRQIKGISISASLFVVPAKAGISPAEVDFPAFAGMPAHLTTPSGRRMYPRSARRGISSHAGQ